jgi:hypothetical protein
MYYLYLFYSYALMNIIKETLFGKKYLNKQKISEIPKQIKNDQNVFFL